MENNKHLGLFTFCSYLQQCPITLKTLVFLFIEIPKPAFNVSQLNYKNYNQKQYQEAKFKNIRLHFSGPILYSFATSTDRVIQGTQKLHF